MENQDLITESMQNVISLTSPAINEINAFSYEVLRTRGGRKGSGMGTLLESLWGYYLNRELTNIKTSYEIGWFSDHDYNDFACVKKDADWNSATRAGELFRVEVKSMIQSADESKAHFDETQVKLGKNDVLLVLVWDWVRVHPTDEKRVYPRITDYFIGPAIPIAELRDRLHIARNGTFVDASNCPDGCKPEDCVHHGEPLNSSGKRERLTGPETLRPSAKVSYANNFGGLVRMLKTDSERAREIFREIRYKSPIAHDYISFIHRNFPNEELNQYTTDEWRQLINSLGMDGKNLKRAELKEFLQGLNEKFPEYRSYLREMFVKP